MGILTGDPGPERTCAKGGCSAIAQRGGRIRYCLRHFRYMHMREGAQRFGKYVPTIRELESMERAVTSDDGAMRCPKCVRVMEWGGGGIRRKNLVTLQHDVSGRVLFLCFSCNAIHAQMGDVFYDIPDGMRRCHHCMAIKPLVDFRVRRHTGRHSARCRRCEANDHREWFQAMRAARNMARRGAAL